MSLNTDWQESTLGQVCYLNLGKTPSRSIKIFWDKNKETNNTWLSIADLSKNIKNKIIYDSKEYITDLATEKCKIVNKGTLLLSFKLSIGKVAFAGKDLYTNEAIMALPLKTKDILDTYLFYYLENYDWEPLVRNDVKVKGKTLNKKKLNTVKVLYPSLETQKAIVKKIDTLFKKLDTSLTLVDEAIAKTDELIKSSLNKMLSPSSEENKNHEWQVVKFADIITLQRGYDLPKIKMILGDIPVVGSNSIIGYHNKYTTKSPFLSIGRSGNVGTPFFIEQDCWAHNTCLFVKDIKNSHMKFIYYLFKTINFKKFSGGSAVPTLNRNNLNHIEILLPPIETQKAIVKKLDVMHEKTSNAKALFTQKKKLIIEMKSAILNKAFKGELL